MVMSFSLMDDSSWLWGSLFGCCVSGVVGVFDIVFSFLVGLERLEEI